MLEKKPLVKSFITVKDFYESLSKSDDSFHILNDLELEKIKIVESMVHRPGLAFAGFTSTFTSQRVQVAGNTEFRFLEQLSEIKKQKAFSNILPYKPPCICFTSGNKLDANLIELAQIAGIPIFLSTKETTEFIGVVSDYLNEQFAEYQVFHGTMVDVYSVGIILTGKSGMGKSEVALDLVERGHKLVGDDVLMISKKNPSTLVAKSYGIAQGFIEIRGVGIIDIQKIFGIRGISRTKQVEVVIELQHLSQETTASTFNLEPIKTKILGTEVQKVILQVFPGKNMTVITEMIALNYLMKTIGYNPAMELRKRVKIEIEKNKLGDDKA